MPHRVCPWWLGYCLACPVLRLGQNPSNILAPYVQDGMTVFEPGPGMGFFTLELARRVGPSGRVVAVDVQPKMIQSLTRRAAKAGLLDRIDARIASAGSADYSDLLGRVDFTLAYAMVHEVPDVPQFFSAVAALSKPGASLLLAEPRGHVKDAAFDAEVQAAAAAGFTVADTPAISRSYAALLRKTGDNPAT